MLCYVMLWYVMICYVTLCYVMKCYVMLCYFMLCYVMICYDMLCYVMLCYVMLCYVMLCYVVLRYVMLCYVVLCFVLYYEYSNVREQVTSSWYDICLMNRRKSSWWLQSAALHIITLWRYSTYLTNTLIIFRDHTIELLEFFLCFIFFVMLLLLIFLPLSLIRPTLHLIIQSANSSSNPFIYL